MEAFFSFLEEFLLFLQQWYLHISSIAFAGTMWIAIVIHLLTTGHASLGSNGNSQDIGCGDSRVWRLFVIFGGPAGLSFGLPFFWLMNLLGLTGNLREYWTGFIYIQFATSVVQTILFLLYCLFGQRSENAVRLFKSHLKGCGWISALSPFGWILYWIQQFVSNEKKQIFWQLRDIETRFVFTFNIFGTPLIPICIIGSSLNRRWIIPTLTKIDQDFKEDEDSSADR